MDRVERDKIMSLAHLFEKCANILSTIIGYDAGKDAANKLIRNNLEIIGGKNSNIIKFPAAQLENTKNEKAVCDAKSNPEEDFDVKLTYGKGSIKKRLRNTNGYEYEYYIGRFYHEGKQHEVCATTKKECFNKMRAKQLELETGEPMPKKTSGGITLSDWLNRWFELFKQKQGNADMLSMYIKRINAYFGDVTLKKLTSDSLQEFINTFSETPNTQKKIYDLLNGSLKKAVAFRHLKANPMDAVERQRFKPKKKRAFEFSEQKKLLTALSPKYAAAFFILCCTGLRIGEYLALSRKDFDCRRMRIRIDKEVDTKTMALKTRVKSDASERVVPFTAQLLEYADKLDPAREYFDITYYGIKKALARAMTSKKIKNDGLSVHSTRHTFMSVCDYVGIRDKLIQTWAGHSTIAMTKDTYTHLLDKGGGIILEYLKGLKEATE